MRDNRWDWIQSLPSRSPVSLALHPSRRLLYAANEIDEYEGLPRGTVEAYKINASDGTLTLINRQPLSLSGVNPRHITVSPDGNYLVAAIHGGGAYNVLPIHADGTVGRVTQILKEVGAGSHPLHQASAHPHTVAFDASGERLLATDEGCDRVSIFTFQNGELARAARTLCRPASGPSHLVIHPSGRFFYVSNTFDGSIDCYHWDRCEAPVNKVQQVLTASTNTSPGGHHLTLSTSGRVLYTASAGEGISVWKIDPMTGKLDFVQRLSLKDRSLLSLSLSSDGERIFAIDRCQGEVLSIPVLSSTGEVGIPLAAAKIIAPRDLVVRPYPNIQKTRHSSLT